MATPLIFGQGKGHFGARAERIAARYGAEIVNYTDPQCNCGYRCKPHTCPESQRHWLTLPNTDPAIVGRRAQAVMAALEIAPVIPRKLALRIWSACLLQQADHLAGLATGARHQPGRGDPPGRLPGASKVQGRLAKAGRLEDQGRVLRGWVNMDHRTRGADLPPELVAIIAAYLFAHGQAVRDLRTWLNDHGHPGWIDGIDTADAPAVIARLLEIH